MQQSLGTRSKIEDESLIFEIENLYISACQERRGYIRWIRCISDLIAYIIKAIFAGTMEAVR